jgi:hypothetical protein
METSNHPISPLRQRMLEDMHMRKLAPKTQQSYIRAVSRLQSIWAFPRHRHGRGLAPLW